MVRLSKNKLPKQVQRHVQQAKHKKSKAKQERLNKKLEKLSSMETEGTEQLVVKTPEEVEAEKAVRKRANAHKNAYKRNIKHLSDRNGPRAYGH